MKQAFVFIYSKLGKREIKALTNEQALNQHSDLIKQGWEHTSTIDACVWIANLYNNMSELDLSDEVNFLAIKP